jgi:predicted esterase
MKQGLQIIDILFQLKRFSLIVTFHLFPYSLFSQTEDSILYSVKTERFEYFDSVRSRNIPVEIYKPKTNQLIVNQKVVVFNHGYGFNRGDSYLGYSYIGEYLASKGYFVVSIQHEQKGDDSLAMKGNLQELRKPNWLKGVQNIKFVLNQIHIDYLNLNTNQIILIGHSNGGDMSMLFTQMYPELVHKVISLDNRRVSLPRVSYPCVYSIRSSDQLPDEGVLPTFEEQCLYNITVVQLPNTLHNDMANNATKKQRVEILDLISKFIEE